MPDSNVFAVELVTPERILIEGLATEVLLRTGEGDVSFLAGHTPLVGSVEPGVLRVVRPEGEEDVVAVHGGFVQVGKDPEADEAADGAAGAATSGTRVTLLIGVAEPVAEIDVERARAALDTATAKVAELTGSSGPAGAGVAEDHVDPELVEAEAARRRAEVRLAAVEGGSSTGPPAAA